MASLDVDSLFTNVPLDDTIEICVNQKQPPEVFYKNGVLRNFTKFTGVHLCQSLFCNKAAGLRPAALLKKDSGTGVFL